MRRRLRLFSMTKRNKNDVMSAVYCLCDGNDRCLISPLDIISLLPAGRKCSAQTLDDVLSALEREGYFDVIFSERKGDKMYVISLKENGFNFRRNIKIKRQEFINKIILALVGAVATFLFGLILKAIFKT